MLRMYSMRDNGMDSSTYGHHNFFRSLEICISIPKIRSRTVVPYRTVPGTYSKLRNGTIQLWLQLYGNSTVVHLYYFCVLKNRKYLENKNRNFRRIYVRSVIPHITLLE